MDIEIIDEHAWYRDPANTPAVMPWEQGDQEDRALADTVIRSQMWWNTREYSILDISSFNDTGRYKYLGIHLLAGNTTLVWVVRLALGNPAIDAQWWIQPPEGHKFDSAFILPGGEAGADIEVWGTTHAAISGPRDNNVAWAVILGAVRFPYPQGVRAIGGAFPILSLTREPNPAPPEPVDYTRIARETVALIIQEMNGVLGTLIQKRAKNGTREGIAVEGVLTQSNVYDSDGLYRRVKETAYESCKNAIKDSKG